MRVRLWVLDSGRNFGRPWATLCVSLHETGRTRFDTPHPRGDTPSSEPRNREGQGMDWGTIGVIAGIQVGLFAWLKWDITKLSDRLGIVERDVSYLRGRLDGPPDIPPARG